MDAKEYLTKLARICRTRDSCDDCPAYGYPCGVPNKIDESDAENMVTAVYEYRFPPELYVCEYGTGEHADDAKFCRVCGAPISEAHPNEED